MKKTLLVILVISIMFSPLALAAPGGATVTEGLSESGTETNADTSSIEGGNITFIDTYSKQLTSNWAGFFGNVSGSIVLEDSGSNLFFEWTINDFDNSVVYAATGAVSDWSNSNIVPANNSVVPVHISGNGLDNFTNTFASTGDFNSSSLDKASVPYVDTWQNGTQGSLKTYALYANTEAESIWAGIVTQDSDSFKSDTYLVDYQILVPAQALTTYSFYLELP